MQCPPTPTPGWWRCEYGCVLEALNARTASIRGPPRNGRAVGQTDVDVAIRGFGKFHEFRCLGVRHDEDFRIEDCTIECAARSADWTVNPQPLSDNAADLQTYVRPSTRSGLNARSKSTPIRKPDSPALAQIVCG